VVQTGLERLLAEKPAWTKDRRLGLLCNQASVNRNFHHARTCVNNAFPGQLKAVFSPQHGLFSEKQDNMKESPHLTDPELAIPVFSLYGKSRSPLKEQLELTDILLIDLQDVGCRVYTYIWTIFLAMKACAEHGVEVAVLDRPNPLGGHDIEGSIMAKEFYSFVGMAPIPMRHGMTVAELAMFFSELEDIPRPHILPMKGWRPSFCYEDTGLPWVMPSPNMPAMSTAVVYPGQVLLEGTNISEGRGTTRPFEIFGAPWLDATGIIRRMELSGLKGFFLRRQDFEPTFNKYAGEHCQGVQIHVVDRKLFTPYTFTLVLLSTIMEMHPDRFEWSRPPYEYEFERLPFDLITGNSRTRQAVEGCGDIDTFRAICACDEKDFFEQRKPYLLYERLP
jgi:uncharacterized protein YbbC (DUF1343 family)